MKQHRQGQSAKAASRDRGNERVDVRISMTRREAEKIDRVRASMATGGGQTTRAGFLRAVGLIAAEFIEKHPDASGR